MTGDDDDNQPDDEFVPTPDPEIDPRDVVNAGSRSGQKRAAKERARLLEQSDNFWRGILSSEIGRREVWKILDSCHAFDTRFGTTNAFPNPEATWFFAGQQEVGQRIYQSLLVLDIDAVKLMHIECDPRFKAPK